MVRRGYGSGHWAVDGRSMVDEIRDIAERIELQHVKIRELFLAVTGAGPADRQERFEPLVRLLAVHETAEEEIVYPAVRAMGGEAQAIVSARLTEEDAAKKALADLEGMDAASQEFAAALAKLYQDVDRHATSEEREVLPLLKRMDAEQRDGMAAAFAAAEAVAPTHAHRMAPESGLGNALLSPFVAIVDRVRDAIRGPANR
jgi:hemerythrin superfamily protein